MIKLYIFLIILLLVYKLYVLRGLRPTTPMGFTPHASGLTPRPTTGKTPRPTPSPFKILGRTILDFVLADDFVIANALFKKRDDRSL